MRTALIIPVRNAGAQLDRLLPALHGQTLKVDDWLVVDSESTDDSVSRLQAAGARILTIPLAQFNHGGTRRWASQEVEADILIYMTQDAIPANSESLQLLQQALLANPELGVAYGRQLPHATSSVLAAHARQFNYPEASCTKLLADAPRLGIKTCFNSDSFSAYRRQALQDVGGFPEDVIGSEDAYVAGKILLAGWGVRYEASAQVYHAHDYSLVQEFQRYFDIGVFYGRERWIADHFGKAGGEGRRFFLSKMRAVWQAGQGWRLPEVVLRAGLNWSGYRMGHWEHYLPCALKRRLGMFAGYWK